MSPQIHFDSEQMGKFTNIMLLSKYLQYGPNCLNWIILDDEDEEET